MTDEQKAAYVVAQSICCLTEVLGMMSENLQRIAEHNALAYNEGDFSQVLNKYGIHHNAVLGLFHGI